MYDIIFGRRNYAPLNVGVNAQKCQGIEQIMRMGHVVGERLHVGPDAKFGGGSFSCF